MLSHSLTFIFILLFVLYPFFHNADVSIVGNNNLPVNFNYLCHPTHLYSTPNVYKKIFNNIELEADDSSLDRIRKITLQITDYDEELDSLIYMDSGSSLIPFQTSFLDGLFEITLDQTLLNSVDISSWSNLLTNFQYKLNLNNDLIGLCDLKDSGVSVYEKSLYLDVYILNLPDADKLTLEVKIILKNSLIVFTDIEPVKITNSASFITIDLPMNSYDKERMKYIVAPSDSILEKQKLAQSS